MPRSPSKKSPPKSRKSPQKKSPPKSRKSPKSPNWTPSMGVMSYGELRIRKVEEDPKVLDKYEGFLYSEKLDGWHVIWDGAGKLYTKSGKRQFDPPQEFVSHLPSGIAISGELVLGGKQAAEVAGLLKTGSLWEGAKIYAFDLPGRAHRDLTFRQRTEILRKLVQKQCKKKCPLRYIPQKTLSSTKSFLKDFHNITHCKGAYSSKSDCFGEGVVLTDPDSVYTSGRVRWRMKLKKREDAEAKVEGHNAASLQVMTKSGVRFTIGIGFTDEQRSNLSKYFPKGKLVKYSFRSLSKNGVPKEARVISIRHFADR